jgi:hypothetical protein
VPHSHQSWEDSLTTCFHQCLTLGRASEYNCVARAFQSMTPTILLKNIVVVLCQLHHPPSYLFPPPIFDHQLEHTFVLDRTLFAQALAITPRLSSGGLFGMVYEHLLGCFIPKDPSSRFRNYFMCCCCYSWGNP